MEALAPNNGDGNNDGTPDYEQENVTSLPVNGGSPCVAAPTTSRSPRRTARLSNVFTADPSDTSNLIETPPPPNDSCLRADEPRPRERRDGHESDDFDLHRVD